MDPERFSIGINYWPKEAAMYWWRRFNSAQVKRDFSTLAEYRFEAVRIFLLWEDFQPEPQTVSVRALDHLVQVADMAQDCRLRILPTFFCGHLRGLNWIPEWLVEPGKAKGDVPICIHEKMYAGRIRNPFAERDVRKAQKLFIHETTSALQGHPAIWGWDLGNQMTQFMNPSSTGQVRAWFEEMLNELKRWDAHLPVTAGLHPGDLEGPAGLRPQDVAPYCDFLSMQVPPPYGPWRDRVTETELPAFLCLMTKWLGGKNVILESFGQPMKPPEGVLNESDRAKSEATRLFSEAEAENYFRQVLHRLKESRVSGAFVWCFADVDPILWDSPPFDERIAERFCGLFRSDGSAKHAVPPFSEFPRRQNPAEPDWTWIDIDHKEYDKNPSAGLKHLYRKFKDWFQRGA
jgi:endo-1,4-beta-mannosidase